MTNYKLWLRFTLVNIVFYSICVFIYIMAVVFSSPDMRLGAIISLSVLLLILAVNISANLSIKRSLDLQLPIYKITKGLILISIVGYVVTMIFSFEPTHMMEMISKDKSKSN